MTTHPPRAAAALAALAAAHAAACVRRLPPAPPPAPVAPAIDVSAPLPAGHGRLVLDVTDGPAPVARVRPVPQPWTAPDGTSRFAFVERPEALCPAAPCVVDLPVGNVLLGFPVAGDPAALDVELVHVAPEVSLHRRTLSQYDGRTGTVRVLGIIAASVGGVAMMTGTALLPAGTSSDNDALAAAGGITLGAGVALVVLGVLGITRDAPTLRPGSSLHVPHPAR